ncbi:EAL domain-containing protein [Tumidithrix elongata RA019]|uniref:EAL domain-containing protein n=1 Tax=Tumidithrix elongata BACA0141 TaxID=2716417 RepID=A0AAW9PVN0_9CYAN|nr:EAL domain-containing protein [Tumidithrix elongata RA019]
MTTILVIEDVDALREEIMETLTYEGFNVLGAENGLVGVRMAQTHLPNLIISDVAMPELDGYGALSILRQNPETGMIPFIFLTAKAEKADMRQAMQLGADDYLTKPFTSEELLGSIAARLRKYDSIKEHYQEENEQATVKLAHLSHYDDLTQLPNRILFHSLLRESILHSQLNHKQIALLFLDIDNFNIINNTLGYDIGDQLFKAIAERLRRHVSPSDVVARLRGDEFAVIFVDPINAEQVKLKVQKILDLLSKSFSLCGQNIFITTSIGITLYPNDHHEADELIKNADLAMYHAKAQGRNSYQFYSSQLNTQSSEHMALANSLHQAFEQNEFRLHYQPLLDLKTKQIVGAEALIRWQHPKLGLVMPGKFIPIAEETGLILRLGEFVITSVCQQLQAWQQKGLPHGRIAINLSGQHFRLQDSLRHTIAKILRDYNISPIHLEVELTESEIMQNSDRTIQVLSELRNIGIHIAIDDFGTGYSSLSYLKHFPVDTLKIDRCFVQDVTTDRHDAAITIAMIDLAHNLSLNVIAEGVETEEQLAFLTQNGCDRMQGYLFSRPVPPEEFEKMVMGGKHL